MYKRQLQITDRDKIAAQELGSICNICSRTPEYGNITHPTQTFITLRTIGWNRHEIRTRRPYLSEPQAVDIITGGRILRSLLIHRTHYDRLYLVWRYRSINTRNLKISESMKGCLLYTSILFLSFIYSKQDRLSVNH